MSDMKIKRKLAIPNTALTKQVKVCPEFGTAQT